MIIQLQKVAAYITLFATRAELLSHSIASKCPEPLSKCLSSSGPVKLLTPDSKVRLILMELMLWFIDIALPTGHYISNATNQSDTNGSSSSVNSSFTDVGSFSESIDKKTTD